MGHIPDRRNLPCEAKKAVRPGKSPFPLFASSVLFCWGWKRAEIMNQTHPSLLAAKPFALKSECGGLLLWAEIYIYRGGKSRAWFVQGLSGCFTCTFLVYCWSLGFESKLSAQSKVIDSLLRLSKATFSHTRWTLFRPTQTCEIPPHMVVKAVPWSRVLNTVHSFQS